LAIAGLADVIKNGLEDFAHRIRNFLDTDPTLNTPLPLIVVSALSGNNIVRSAASIKDLLSVPVDFNGDGSVTGVETELDSLDGPIKDGKVDLEETLIGGSSVD